MNRKLISLAAVAVAIAAIAGAGYAAIPSANGTISACKDNKGALKVIDVEASQSCGPNQQQLNWNQQGPAGPTGPQGSAGPQGPAGRDGVSGREIKSIASAYNSNTEKSAVAMCSSGKVEVGGGAMVGTQNGPSWITPEGVALVATRPTGNGWGAVAKELVPTDEQWQLDVYAVCVDAS